MRTIVLSRFATDEVFRFLVCANRAQVRGHFVLSTSNLQGQVSKWVFANLSEYEPKENARPDWLITPEGERL